MRAELMISFLFLLGCNSAKKQLSSLLAKTDKVRLIKYDKSDTMFCDITDTVGIKIFTEIIDGRQDNINGRILGNVLFYSNDEVIFKATFIRVGIEYDFNNLHYKSLVTRRAGWYFSEASYHK